MTNRESALAMGKRLSFDWLSNQAISGKLLNEIHENNDNHYFAYW